MEPTFIPTQTHIDVLHEVYHKLNHKLKIKFICNELIPTACDSQSKEKLELRDWIKNSLDSHVTVTSWLYENHREFYMKLAEGPQNHRDWGESYRKEWILDMINTLQYIINQRDNAS